MAINKIEKFNCLLDCLYEKLGEQNDLSVLKTQKLLFLTVIASKKLGEEDSLLTDFNFEAWSYGPVDAEIYDAYRNSISQKYIMSASSLPLSLNRDYEHVVEDEEAYGTYLKKVVKAVDRLITLNRDILNLNAFTLVEITHKYNSWKYNFDIGNKTPISVEQLMQDREVFTL